MKARGLSGAGYYLWANTENLTLAGSTPFGVGNDVLFGEAGGDIFAFERGTGGDVIGDFAAGTDKVQLAGLGFSSFDQVQGAMSTDEVSRLSILAWATSWCPTG